MDNAAVIALVVANIALVIGWLVSGTQRVAEDLVKERRTRYLALLTAVEKSRHASVAADADVGDVAACRTAAEFVATDKMIDSGLIARLAQSATADEGTWAAARAAFLVAARQESQHNQATRRWLRRRSLYG